MVSAADATSSWRDLGIIVRRYDEWRGLGRPAECGHSSSCEQAALARRNSFGARRERSCEGRRCASARDRLWSREGGIGVRPIQRDALGGSRHFLNGSRSHPIPAASISLTASLARVKGAKDEGAYRWYVTAGLLRARPLLVTDRSATARTKRSMPSRMSAPSADRLRDRSTRSGALRGVRR